jgi:RNA polymerase sigma factor (sigma-70 family)
MLWMLQLPAGSSLDQLPDPDVDVCDAVVANLEAARIRRLVAQLPPAERAVIRWRYGLGGDRLTHREIAARLGISVGGAWNLEQRALELLRGSVGVAEAA